MSKQNNVETPKTVSVDTKKNLALPLSSTITMEEIKKTLHIEGLDLSPMQIFALLIGDKDVCTPGLLSEMFHLKDDERQQVFYEGSYKDDRGYYTTELAYTVLEREYTWDEEDRPIPLEFSSAQQKLRALLVKCIKMDRYEEIAEEFETNYGTSILYDIALELDEGLGISEDEVLDALNTYQAEHQS